MDLTGYRAVARAQGSVLAVVRDQVQHRTALALGVPDTRIRVFETYEDAARAILDGRAHAYASVARAHDGFLAQGGHDGLDVVAVAAKEKEPAFGCFAFNKSGEDFRKAIDDALTAYLGSREHRAMMKGFGFSDADVDLVWPGTRSDL